MDPTQVSHPFNRRILREHFSHSSYRFPGSTYNGDCSAKTGDGSNFSSAYKTQLKQMFETQTVSNASTW